MRCFISWNPVSGPGRALVRFFDAIGSQPAALAGRMGSAGFCPVDPRIIHLDSDHKGIIRIGLTMNDAGTRVEIATDRSNRKLLIQPPNPLRHNSGAAATDVDGGSDFEGWIIWAIKIHKHLHRDASFLRHKRGVSANAFPSSREVPQ